MFQIGTGYLGARNSDATFSSRVRVDTLLSDHVALPFRRGFSEVYRAFAERGTHEQTVFLGAGRLGLPTEALATQNTWLARGLDPTDKSVRLANHVSALRQKLVRLSNAMGVEHPRLVDPAHVEIRLEANHVKPVRELYGYHPAW